MPHLCYGSTLEASEMLPALSLLLPIPFIMGLTTGTAQMRLEPKKIKQARNQGTIFPKIKKQIRWLCCIITVCSLYKELQILFYISRYRNEPRFYLKDVEFSIICIHISVENTHSLKLSFSLKKNTNWRHQEVKHWLERSDFNEHIAFSNHESWFKPN